MMIQQTKKVQGFFKQDEYEALLALRVKLTAEMGKQPNLNITVPILIKRYHDFLEKEKERKKRQNKK